MHIKRPVTSRQAMGMTVTIFNPTLDANGDITEKINSCLANGFKSIKQ
jgi:hypothetical protein